MRFLILFALVAAASADYHDDVFHFTTLQSGVNLNGLQKSSSFQTSSPALLTANKYATVTKKYTNVQSAPESQPAYTQQYSAVKEVAVAPVLFKSVEQEIPAYSQQYTVKQVTQPAYSQYSAVQQVAQPVYSQYSAVQQVAQPVYSQQYAVQKVAQPVYSQQNTGKQVAQPVYSQQYAVKQVAQPAYSQYSTVKQVAQPVYSQQYAVQQVAQPVYTQHSTVQQVAQPEYSQYTVKKVSQPAVFSQTQYSSKPLVAQQYSASAQSGVSSYASAYNGPQYRILSQVHEVDPSGPYKVSYSTENGIQFSEEGSLINGEEGAVVAVQGSYSYTGPDGVVYTVNYIADDNGFRAAGDHLPTQPIPLRK